MLIKLLPANKLTWEQKLGIEMIMFFGGKNEDVDKTEVDYSGEVERRERVVRMQGGIEKE